MHDIVSAVSGSELSTWSTPKHLEASLCRTELREVIRKTEVRKCLLSFGAESFVFQVAVQEIKD